MLRLVVQNSCSGNRVPKRKAPPKGHLSGSALLDATLVARGMLILSRRSVTSNGRGHKPKYLVNLQSAETPRL